VDRLHRERSESGGMRLACTVACVLGLMSIAVQEHPTQSAPKFPSECAGYTLRLSEAGQGVGATSDLEIRQGSRTVKTISDWRIMAVVCTDATGDGKPKLIVESHSGGMHCCTTIRVFLLQPSFRQILNYEAGNAGGFMVLRTPNGSPALALGDDSFAYYDDLCYACSPAHMPLVACYSNGRFVDCTRQFPQLIQEAIRSSVERLKEAVADTHESRLMYMKGGALGVYAAHVLLGREADGRALVMRIVPEPEVTTWLVNQRGGVMKWLRSRTGRLKP
jgi:hypothetical protein